MASEQTTALPTGLSASYWRAWATRAGLSVNESLDNGEEWIGSWDAVGLYEQNNKIPGWQEMIVHLTTHRLLLLQALSEPTSSRKGLQTNMSYIRQTEFYVGFMRSSPKITLSLGLAPSATADLARPTSGTDGQEEEAQAEWSCPVCGHANPIGDRGYPRPDDKCGLCGVTYGKSSAMGPNGRATPLSTSRPATPKLPSDSTASLPPSPSTPVVETRIACPACTFLNHPSMRQCEICDTALPRQPPAASSHKRQTSMDTAASVGSGHEVIRLSFRDTSGKGGKECYRRLKNVLSDKAWERQTTTSSDARNGNSTPRGAGIDGIMQSISLDAKAKDDRMQDAFKDLEVLMVRAGEMVKLAQSLSARLPQTPQNSEEETLLRTSLVQLGLPTPALTQDMVRDDRLYLEGLARELGTLLVGRGGSGGLMLGQGGRGVVGLDEVWVIWMRARGVALLPPSTLISVLPYLPQHTEPAINLLTLPSFLKVLHTPHYSTQALLSRTLNRLMPQDGEEKERNISAIELAGMEDLAIGMASEMLESVEMSRKEHGLIGGMAGIVRDDQAEGGTRWYRDLISAWHIQLVS